MIYLINIVLSIPFSYGLINLLGNDNNINYIYFINAAAFYFTAFIFNYYFKVDKRLIDPKSIIASIGFAIIIALGIFISTKNHRIDNCVFWLIVFGSLVSGFMIYQLFLFALVEEKSIKIFCQKKGNIGNVNVLECFLLCILFFFMISWLFLENHNVYKDEAAKYLSLQNVIYWMNNKSEILYKIKVLYLFDLNYPPLFFLMSLPFLEIFWDWVIAGRIYVILVSIINMLFLFFYLKKHMNNVAAILGCLFLCTSYQYIAVSREYTPEILIISFILICLILCNKYSETKTRWYLLILGFIIALGMLTKYNFFIYITIPIVYYLYTAEFGKFSFRLLLKDLILLLLPFLLIGSPWYIYTFITNPANTSISGFINQKTIGRFQSNVSIKQAIIQIFQDRGDYFPDYIYLIFLILLISFIVIVSIDSIKKTKVTTKYMELIVIPLSTVVILSISLKTLGLILNRWNFSYLFLSIIFSYMFERVFINKNIIKIVFGIAIYIFFLLSFINTGIINIFNVDLIGSKNYLPNEYPTGAKEVAEYIRNDRKMSKIQVDEPITVGLIGHIHDGLHGHALAYYGKWLGLNNWKESNVGLLNGFKPTDLSIFLDSDYLVYIPNNQYNYEESAFPNSLLRYQWLIENAPTTYQKCLQKIGIVNSRFGIIRIDKIDKNCFTSETFSDLILLGKMFDQNDASFTLFWEVEELKYQYQLGFSGTEIYDKCKTVKIGIDRNKAEFSDYYWNLIYKDIKLFCN
jgi:hypothetical protein